MILTIFRIAKHLKADGERKTGYNGVRLSERVLDKVIVDKKGIKDSWKEYMKKLMNKENE